MAEHPAAIGIELMNEPPIVSADLDAAPLYQFFRECYEAVREIAGADMGVGVMDFDQVRNHFCAAILAASFCYSARSTSTKKRSIYQDGLGTNVGKAPTKKREMGF